MPWTKRQNVIWQFTQQTKIVQVLQQEVHSRPTTTSSPVRFHF